MHTPYKVSNARVVWYDIIVNMPAYNFRITGDFIIGDRGTIEDEKHINQIISYFIGIHEKFNYELKGTRILNHILFSQTYFDKTFWTSMWCLIPVYYGYHSVLSDTEVGYKVTDFYIKPLDDFGLYRSRPKNPYILL